MEQTEASIQDQLKEILPLKRIPQISFAFICNSYYKPEIQEELKRTGKTDELERNEK